MKELHGEVWRVEESDRLVREKTKPKGCGVWWEGGLARGDKVILDLERAQ